MKRFLKGFGIFLLLAGIGVASAFGVIALLLQQEEVRVPDLTGQDIVTTIETLTQLGLQLKVDRREPNATIAKDSVISQSPAPGSGIKKGRQVKVVVSLGPSELQAPKLAGEHFRKAEVLVRQAGFFPGNLSRVSSETVERDVVIAQSPEPGTPLEKGGRISMLVSAGKEQPVYAMPELIGKRAEAAARAVEGMGLQHRLVYKAVENRPQPAERLVIGQKPLPGHPVTTDGVVEIVVRK
jgi:serine/threonine-protein kinase